MLSELSLSEQIAIELERAERLKASMRAALALLDPPAPPAVSPPVRPAPLPLAAGGSNPLVTQEHHA
jgi:hypothetical protein